MKTSHKEIVEPGMVAHICNLSTQEDCKFKASRGYLPVLIFKKLQILNKVKTLNPK
jgi:hypothetical protein